MLHNQIYVRVLLVSYLILLKPGPVTIIIIMDYEMPRPLQKPHITLSLTRGLAKVNTCEFH